jgi:serine/threonine protein kinase
MRSAGPENDGTRGYAFDDFDQLDRIGAGGTADVYRARLETDDGHRHVALKTPRLSEYETVEASFFDAFVEEASIWNRIDDHDNIVSVLDWGTEPYPWIAMEYMDAGHLGDRADDLSRPRKVAAFRDVCTAVYHAHRHGITHGDLKPENVLLTRDGDGVTPKVGDWGLAKVLLDHSRSRDGLTMAYSAPEQIDPDTYGQTDDRTDVYQLSAVAYELFAGTPPFEAEGTGELVHRILHDEPPRPSTRADVPEALDEAIRQGLSTAREDRYETVLYLRDAVEAAMADEADGSDGTAIGESADANSADSGPSGRRANATSTGSGSESGVGPNERTGTRDPQAQADRTGTATTNSNRESAADRTTRSASRQDASDDTVTTWMERDDRTPADDVTPDASDDDVTPEASTETGGLFDRLHRPVESMDHGRGVVRSVSFALNYPRAADRRTVANWWVVAIASIFVVPAPLMIGYFLETVRQADAERAPTIRLGDGNWLRRYGRGVVGFAALFGPFLAFAVVSDPSGTGGTSDAAGFFALLTVVSWYFLPGLLSGYATGGLSALASTGHWRRYASLRYLGTLAGFFVVIVLAYLVTVGLALTLIGIAVAYFYLMVAVGGFLGRRARSG